jgi:hypothetical protein
MDALLNFFEVSSPESWRTVWNAYSVAYRQTHAFAVREESVAAWVREVEIQARAFPLRNFDEHVFVASLPKLKSLSRRRVDETMMTVLQETCANFGVAVVIVPELPNTGISGCARWLTDTKALVGLTLRYKTDDQLWFTLFHFDRRIENYVVGKNPLVLSTLEEIAEGRRQTMEALRDILQARGDTPIEVVGRWGKKITQRQILQLREWLASLKLTVQ